ncbi:MAG: hypothetical protein LBD69_04310 [Puniceicoccales bacterium]|jgi:hypothetical protein|nr:hypothetical protein [Puniceicoccales bacterium]
MNLGQIETFLKEDDYDTVILANSHLANTFSDECKIGKGALKLVVGGGDIIQYKYLLDRVLSKTNRITNIVYGFELWWAELYGSSPECMDPYKEYKNKLSFLLAFNNTIYSAKELWLQYVNSDLGYAKTSLNEWMFYWDLPYVQKLQANFCKKVPKITKPSFKSFSSCLQKQASVCYDNIDQYILPFVEQNPKTTFYFLIIPYSFVQFLAEVNGEDCAQKYISYQRYFIKRLSSYHNVRIYGFHTCDFINNLANYHELSHYHPDINRYMLYAIQNNRHRLTMENLEQYEQAMIENLKAFEIKDTYPHMDSLEDIIRQEEAKLFSLDKPLLSHK